MTVYGSNYTQKCSKLLQWNMCKVFNVWPKQNTEGLSFMTLKGDAKFEEKLTCGLENDMRNIANFYQSNLKSRNWDNDGIL